MEEARAWMAVGLTQAGQVAEWKRNGLTLDDAGRQFEEASARKAREEEERRAVEAAKAEEERKRREEEDRRRLAAMEEESRATAAKAEAEHRARLEEARRRRETYEQEARRRKEARDQAVRRVCPSGLESLGVLIRTNPYDVAGRCYSFAGRTLQLLGRTQGLYSVSYELQPFLVDFGGKSAPPLSFRGTVIGIGTYSYQSVNGAGHIVPSLRAIEIPDE